MKRFFAGFSAAALSLSLAVSFAACASGGKAFGSPDVSFEIDGTASAAAEDRISDLLFGAFLEDINFASYAMDDNLICNGSFEYGSAAAAWKANGISLSVADEAGVRQGASYAVVNVTSAGGTLTNGGYAEVPIAVKKDVTYDFSAFIWASGYGGGVTVRVTDGTKTYAESAFTVAESGEWAKYKVALTATDTASSGLSVVLEFASAGTLLLDGVQLETNDSTVGVKNYIYEAIRDLSPKFIRFPGGCVIEGRTMEDAYDWKNSVGVDSADEVPELSYTLFENGDAKQVSTRGEAVTRTPNTDIWQTGNNYYLMEYGIGFYEYFVLCDSLGASAIPIVNAGLSCMIQTGSGNNGTYNTLEGRYGNGVNDYIQDALDLVAFAKGDPDSDDENEAYWAQVRADMGHEAPFDMRYLGIGNEQWGGTYYSYYEQFLEAFRAAAKENPLYGEVELIVGNGTVFGNCENAATNTVGLARAAARMYRSSGAIDGLSEYGVHDHHYYMNYVDFFANTTLYDKYSRSESTGYDVFVGEYSANMAQSLGGDAYDFTGNSWITALSEAAYMTGLERNGDVVKLAAYAPMFGNYTNNQWAVNMMFFTNTELVFTPNYYVQQLFARNQGDTVLSVTEKYASGFERTYRLQSAGTGYTEINKVYQIVSKDAETGDVIVKIVNASADEIKINFDIASAIVTGEAEYTVLQCDDVKAVNTRDGEKITPAVYTQKIGAKFGYLAEKYSVTAIRIHVQ